MADNYITNYNGNTISALTQDIDVNGKKIQGAEVDIRTNASNGDVIIQANGSGNVKINGLNFPKTDGNPNEVLITDGAGNLRFVRPAVGGGSGSGSYYWQLAADDSTAIPILTDNVVKFIGGNGITTAADTDDGNLTISQTSNDFSITGEATASAVTYNGTGNVALSVTLNDNALDDQYLRLDGTTQPTATINFNAQNITNVATITATTFSGTLSGNVTGNITGNTSGVHTGDVKGSVFANDSTMLVDGVGGLIVGDVVNTSVATGTLTSQIVDASIVSAQNITTTPLGGLTWPVLTITSDDGSLIIENNNPTAGPGASKNDSIQITSHMNGVFVRGEAYVNITAGPEGGPYADMDLYGGPITLNGQSLIINSEEISIGNVLTTFAGELDFTNASVKNLNVFNIGADDSTMRAVDVSTNIKFIGGTNITTASDADGNITITNSFTQDFAFGSLTGTPTTLSGYGITDALALAGGTMSGAIDLGSNNITNGGTITATSFVGPVTGNTTGYHTGDVTGSVFADDSTVMIDAVNTVVQGQVKLTGMTTGTGVGADTGSADFLPTRPVGYITISINGTDYKVPYYNA